MTTRLDSTGAMAGAVNRRCACKIPYSTTASPYSRTWGANTTSIRVLTPTMAACAQRGAPASSSEASGPAVTAMITLTGASSRTVQDSIADAIWLAWVSALSGAVAAGPVAGTRASRRAAGPASTGIRTLVRAPPRTMS